MKKSTEDSVREAIKNTGLEDFDKKFNITERLSGKHPLNVEMEIDVILSDIRKDMGQAVASVASLNFALLLKLIDYEGSDVVWLDTKCPNAL